MEIPAFPDKVAQQLKLFAQRCMVDPSLLHDPKLSFIKELIEHFGGKIPEAKDASSAKCEFENSVPEEPQPPKSEPESEESDVELDMTDVIGTYLCCWHCVFTCHLRCPVQ